MQILHYKWTNVLHKSRSPSWRTRNGVLTGGVKLGQRMPTPPGSLPGTRRRSPPPPSRRHRLVEADRLVGDLNRAPRLRTELFPVALSELGAVLFEPLPRHGHPRGLGAAVGPRPGLAQVLLVVVLGEVIPPCAPVVGAGAPARKSNRKVFGLNFG